MSKSTVIVCHWLPDGELTRRCRGELPDIEFVDAKTPDALSRADIAYGLPDLAAPAGGGASALDSTRVGGSAGGALPDCQRKANSRHEPGRAVWADDCRARPGDAADSQSKPAGCRAAIRRTRRGTAAVADTMRDLHSKTLAIVGLGNIGSNIGRLAKAFGMRVIGCKRTAKPCPGADGVYPSTELRAMLAEADHVAIAAPLTPLTDGMVGLDALQALKPRAILINVSRGPIVQEKALIEVLRNGPLGGAGLDVFAVEPLPATHPFWAMPNVLVSPHYSGMRRSTRDRCRPSDSSVTCVLFNRENCQKGL